VIEVVFNRGLYLPEMDFWLDPWDAKEQAFVSHAHADHFSRHETAICSALTGQLLRARFKMGEARLRPLEFGESMERNGFRIRLLPAGHIVGSAMIHLTRQRDGKTLLYTGDFKVRKGRTTEQVSFIQADTLIMETTFGLPHMVFPSPMEVDASVLRFVNDALVDGETPVLFSYSLGKAQELIALLHEHGIPVLSHPRVADMTEACRQVGVDLPEPEIFEGLGREGYAVVAPPNSVKAKILRGLKHKRTAMLSGWALQQSARYRYRVDEVIPMSDHADYPGLMECVTRVRPKRVLTVHGFAKEFAADLREKGFDAWSAMGGDQLELSLEKGAHRNRAAVVSRQSRPACQLADFSDVCRLIGETSSRISKVEYLVNYLKGLELSDLELVCRWFAGELGPRHGGYKISVIGNAGIKRALLNIPGIKEERYREISASQNELSRTTRVLLQELSKSSKPLSHKDLYELLKEISNSNQALEKVSILSKRLFELHPFEAETLVRILTGDLRVGLKAGLVEDAIANAFQSNVGLVRSANMLTGDLGLTACLAKKGELDSAEIRPLVPVRCMLASPIERDESDDSPRLDKIPFEPPYWVEPKHDGIRAQLHKVGSEVGLFSRDLRPLDLEFPELVEAAKQLVGDFILDGELIAYAKGRKLGFADLQKRLGRKRVEEDLFMDSGDASASVPLRYVAFDILWSDGEGLLERSITKRRSKLETLSLGGIFSMIEVQRPESESEILACFKRSIEEGYEGLIFKDPESLYSPGRRGKSWLKLKGVMPTLDCVVVFAEQGHGKRSDVLSDYTFAVRDERSGELRVIGKAYSGLTDEEIEELTEHFEIHTLSKKRRKREVEPNLVLEIAFDAIRRSPRHDSGFALRFPRIKAIRRDKTVDEIDTLQAAERLFSGAASLRAPDNLR